MTRRLLDSTYGIRVKGQVKYFNSGMLKSTYLLNLLG